MNFLFIFIAVCPLAGYFAFLAGLHGRARSTVVFGTIDLLLLSLGLSGLVFIGPFQLVAPVESLVDKGWLAWGMILVLYFLFVLLTGQLRRIRLVVYSVDPKDARDALNHWAKTLDPKVERAGDSWFFPERELEIRLDLFSAARCAVVKIQGKKPTPAEWLPLEKSLAAALAGLPGKRGRVGWLFAALALIFAASAVALWIRHDGEIREDFYVLTRNVGDFHSEGLGFGGLDRETEGGER